MKGVKTQDPGYSEFAEVDPSGRYGRYNEILGKGASKIVYRAFDEFEGIEVAWNQVKLHDFLQSPEDLERLYCEIHLLKTLKHKNIMKFYTSWVDVTKRNINFITEMFTSGTLRQYRQRHRNVNIRAVKHWCRQILNGLLYLHSHDPPVIHRDLKCDNIFVNGSQGIVKIGDLGLAAILRKPHVEHCVGTPEFMAPEVYDEEYNELVDIYSFGMCVLEMVTFEYPYNECTHPAQIYKKVVCGIMPEALYKVKDTEVRQFIKKCLATASQRLSAKELLNDPFLRIEENGSGYGEGNTYRIHSIRRQPSGNDPLILDGLYDDFRNEAEIENCWDTDVADNERRGFELFSNQENEHFLNVDITIKGTRKDDGGIFLRLRIYDRNGHVRNIYFLFDIEADTALSVATEMVAELDIIDHEVTRIADMIDWEVCLLVPEWKPGPGIEDVQENQDINLCQNCRSNVSLYGSILDNISLKIPDCNNLKSVHCVVCASMNGQFEEITYQAEGSEQSMTEGPPILSPSQSDDPESCFLASERSHYDKDGGELGRVSTSRQKSDAYLLSDSIQQNFSEIPQLEHQESLLSLSEDYENTQKELRWLEANYGTGLKEYENQRLRGSRRDLHPSDFGNWECVAENEVSDFLNHAPLQASKLRRMKSFHLGRHFSFPIPVLGTDS